MKWEKFSQKAIADANLFRDPEVWFHQQKCDGDAQHGRFGISEPMTAWLSNGGQCHVSETELESKHFQNLEFSCSFAAKVEISVCRSYKRMYYHRGAGDSD